MCRGQVRRARLAAERAETAHGPPAFKTLIASPGSYKAFARAGWHCAVWTPALEDCELNTLSFIKYLRLPHTAATGN